MGKDLYAGEGKLSPKIKRKHTKAPRDKMVRVEQVKTK
jgi:hypothetical protein